MHAFSFFCPGGVIFDGALSVRCTDVVSPAGKQPGKYYLPPTNAPKSPRQKFGGIRHVGAAARLFSPWGKQRRRRAPTIQFQTFANEIRR